MLRRRVVLLFSNSLALEGPGLMKRYGQSQNGAAIELRESLNITIAAIPHHFLPDFNIFIDHLATYLTCRNEWLIRSTLQRELKKL